MRVLIYVPQSRTLSVSLASIHALDVAPHSVTMVFDREERHDSPDWHEHYENALIKMRRARKWVLEGGYDALFSVEDDIIVPPDALGKLDDLGADIAYGLAVWRNPPHQWSATLAMEWGVHVETLDEHPGRAREAWGRAIPTFGCGLFCTLIRRPVLEAIDFHRMGPAAADWGLAFDAREKGFSQITHLGVVCGHIEPAKDEIYWPDIEAKGFYRADKLSEYRQEKLCQPDTA